MSSTVDHPSGVAREGLPSHSPSYALGYSVHEFRRLESQGAFLRDLTEYVLRRAGLEPGMRVLDVGSGMGDLSLLAAELVGPSGSVLGIDRSAEAANMAGHRAAAAGQHQVRFASADLDAFATDETFDAIIGRLILMYLPDPAATLRKLCEHLSPRGVVVFQEMAMPLARSVPEGPEFCRCRGWILATFERAGFDIDMGSRLYPTFLNAGLPAPEMIVSGRAEGGPESFVYDYLASVLRSLLPLTERLNIATRAEVDIDAVAERLRREAVENNACIMPPALVGAWTRKSA